MLLSNSRRNFIARVCTKERNIIVVSYFYVTFVMSHLEGMPGVIKCAKKNCD